jgi:cation:H+ antiporter
VTGFGTTVPEITIAALAVHRNEGDIAVGTLLGSNVTDPLFSLGVGAIVGGFAIERVGATLTSATYMMVAAGLVALWFFLTGGISRRAAVGCIALYVPTFLL